MAGRAFWSGTTTMEGTGADIRIENPVRWEKEGMKTRVETKAPCCGGSVFLNPFFTLTLTLTTAEARTPDNSRFKK